MEEIRELDSMDLRVSKEAVTRLQKRLLRGRDAAALIELLDYYLASGSSQAAKVLLALRETHAQDFFDRLNECLHHRPTCLAVLRLLALTLNTQASWLYRIVDHSLFHSILHCLKTSGDVAVLVGALLVITALLPRVPSYISQHLPDLFELLTLLATIRETGRMGRLPPALYLHLDVAVFYFFLQLYGLFPQSLCTHLRARYGPAAEDRQFHHYIAPLFSHVQLHPGLITDSQSYETSKAKWGSMDPHEIATLSFSLMLNRTALPQPSVQDQSLPPSSTPAGPAHHPAPGKHGPTSADAPLQGQRSSSVLFQPPALLLDYSDAAVGLKTGEEIAEFWSPALVLGQDTPTEASRNSSRLSVTSHHVPSPGGPSSSASSSVLLTPTRRPFMNYSPTASLDVDGVLPSPSPSLAHSAAVTPSRLESSLSDGPFAGERSSGVATSTRLLESDKHEPLSQSIKVKLERFVGLFSRRVTGPQENPSQGTGPQESPRQDNEDFTILSRGPSRSSGQLSGAELGQECLPGSDSPESSGPLHHSPSPLHHSPSPLHHSPSPHHHSPSPHASGTSLGSSGASPGSSCQWDDQDPLCSLKTLIASPQVGTALPVPPRAPDSRRFSVTGVVPPLDGAGSMEPHPSSLPGFLANQPARRHSRNTQSESDSAQTVLQVQHRLQQLVRTDNPGPLELAPGLQHPGSPDPLELVPQKEVGVAAPLLQASASSATLAPSSPPRGGLAPSSPPRGGGSVAPLGVGSAYPCKLLGHLNCQPEALNMGSGQCLSPVSALDQFVAHGRLLHSTGASESALTEQDGVEWEWFGGCPHVEALIVAQSQAGLLHSQLLFERHQCLQHARRNRRLLSEANDARRLAEEYRVLRQQVGVQEGVVASLRDKLHEAQAGPTGCMPHEERLQGDNVALSQENSQLRDACLRLSGELSSVRVDKQRLSVALQDSRARIFALESESERVQPQLARAAQLGQEVASLSRQLQVLGELRQQERGAGPNLVSSATLARELALSEEAMAREREAMHHHLLLLEQDVACARGRVSELEGHLKGREAEVTALRSQLSLQEGRAEERIKAVEEKYQAALAVSQQLQRELVKRQGQPSLQARPTQSTRQRSSSQPGRQQEQPSGASPQPPLHHHLYSSAS